MEGNLLSDKKEVLLVTTGFPASRYSNRGAFILRVMTELVRDLSWSVTVLTPQGEKTGPLFDQKEDWQKKLAVHRYAYFFPKSAQILTQGSIPGIISKKIWPIVLVPFLLFKMAFSVFTHMKNCNLIHAQWSISALFPVLFKSLHRKKIVLTVHGSDLTMMDRGPGKILNSFIFRRCDAVVTITPLQKSWVEKRCSRVEVIPNGADTESFTPCENKNSLKNELGLSADKVHLLYIGMLIPVKGVSLIIELAARLKQKNLPPFQISLIGEGPEEEELKKLSHKLGCSDVISFRGSVPFSEMPKWARSSDISLSSSYSEGLSTTLSEAAACSVPIVATRAGDTDMVVRHGLSGYIVENRDLDEFIEACSKLIEDPKLRKTMGEAGLQHLIRSRNTSKCSAEDYSKLYQSLLGEVNKNS